jgi:hypothetical protein
MKNKIIAVLGVLSFASAFAPTSFAAEQPADRARMHQMLRGGFW